MKISHNWLTHFIELPEPPETVSEILTQTGLEVENILKIEKIKGGLEGLIIGEVINCSQHPNSNKLKLTRVNVGSDDPLDIVCGAPNVRVGQKVVVAPVNCWIYPIKKEPFQIKETKIRGEVSEGMLCAEDEIGLGINHEGIMILTTDYANGTPLNILYKCEKDVIYEISVTPNRGDATSHLGTARDLKAFFNRQLTLPNLKDFDLSHPKNPIKVTLEDQEGTLRYSGVTLRELQVSSSPDWLKWKLKAIDLEPINNIVDITNYVLHSLGQPMHAFDAKEVGDSIIVKRLPTDTPFITLDGKERKLSDQDLMICNSEGGICLAGIFGGEKSGVTNETTDIFLESACFSPEYIRSTTQRHGLNTDASFRFERSTDPEMTIFALKYATQLILEIAGGYIASDFIDFYPNPITTEIIPTSFQTFDKLIGESLEKKRIIDILNSLDIKTTNINKDTFNAHVPPYRSDVTREADLVEEVLRIYGINNIPFDDHFSTGYLAEFNEIEPYKWQEKISHFLSGKGFQEILTNSLTSQKYENDLKLGKNEVVEIINRSSEDLGILKPTPLYTALESVRFNLNRKQESLKLFEFSKTYARKNSQLIETNNLCLFRVGNKQEASWMEQTAPVTFHHLFGDVEDLIQKSGNDSPEFIPTTSSIFEYGIELYDQEKLIGQIGKIAPKISQYFDIKYAVFYGEIDWDHLVKKAENIVSFQKISKYPEVRRDLSLIIKKNVTYDKIKQIARSTEKKLLSKINVFNIYEGDKIGNENKAYAIAFYLQDQEKTLNDKQIDKIMSKLIHRFENELNATIRK
tara:strand:+ start:884 stop:3292 length:2409 start_codon:yes stop_codon:yes gene_type:complete